MTHSLHRRGSVESLKKDFVFLCTPAKGVNNKGAAKKLIKILDIVMASGPANIGFYGHGSLLTGVNINAVKEAFHDNSRVRCCFDDKGKLKEALRQIQAEDTGLSITVSGLIDDLLDISSELSLQPHTINISCGTFGKMELLPSAKILEITSMCGHGMISAGLVENIAQRLRTGALALDEAVTQIGAPCTCGIFNPSRARDLLSKMVETAD